MKFAWALCASALVSIDVGAQVAYPTSAVNLRAGPDSGYPVVARVAPGAGLTLFGCLGDWSWCDVAAGANRGWVYAKFLVYPYQSRRVPIVTHGPALGLPVVTFSIVPYWDSYYRARPWYPKRSHWEQRPAPGATPRPAAQ